jgi:REP element-mobilizing transposase RayT
MDPLAFLLTWTTYGSWLHGDARGWVHSGQPGIQPTNPQELKAAQSRMKTPSVILNELERKVVEATIKEHCRIRSWELHAINVRSNHVHLVVTAAVPPETVMRQLKAWCARRLTESLEKTVESGGAGEAVEQQTKDGRRRWWTEHGSTKWINDEGYLQNAIRYVLEGQ